MKQQNLPLTTALIPLILLYGLIWIVKAAPVAADARYSPSDIFLVANPGASVTTLDWIKLDGLPDLENDNYIYTVSRLDVAANQMQVLVSNTTKTSHIDSDSLAVGNTYCYSVEAYRQSAPSVFAGRSNQSCFVFGDMSLQLAPLHQTLILGQSTDIQIDVKDAVDLYGLEVSCQLYGSSVGLQSNSFGDFFQADRLIARDVLTNAQWDGAVSQRNPAPALSGDGHFATLSLASVDAGATMIDCSAEASDRNGNALTINLPSTLIVVELPTGDPEGTFLYQTRPSPTAHANINVSANGPDIANTATDEEGKFVFFDLLTGDYLVKANVAGHLDSCHNETVYDGLTTVLDPIIMKAGDTDGDGTISMIDAVALTVIFGDASNPPLSIDFNADGIVNIQDLAPLGGNFGESTNCIP